MVGQRGYSAIPSNLGQNYSKIITCHSITDSFGNPSLLIGTFKLHAGWPGSDLRVFDTTLHGILSVLICLNVLALF